MHGGLKLTLAIALFTALAACRSPAPTPPSPMAETAPSASPANGLADEYRRRADAGEKVYEIDAGTSDVRIYVFRGGKAARLGHNHVLSAPGLRGYVSLPADAAAGARFELQLRFDELRIDDPALREQTGGSFAGARSESDISGTTRNMLGPRVLDAAAHPLVRIESLAIEGDWPMLVARIAIEMHGQRRERDVLLQVDREGDRMRIRGELLVRQSEFGIAPLSILGGVIAVQDPIGIRFDLQARRL